MFREPRDKVVQDHRKVIMGLHAAFLNVIAAIRCLVLRREVKVPGHGFIVKGGVTQIGVKLSLKRA